MLFPASVQPSILSLFSSTGSDPLTLFQTSVDKSLPSDSFIHLLHDHYSNPPPPAPGSLLQLPNISEQDDSPGHGYELDQTVLHIQSPTIQTTYIQCPKAELSNALGIKHPWMHLQVRNLGREWAFEVGIVDHAGRIGIVRLSTFQIIIQKIYIYALRRYLSLSLRGIPLSSVIRQTFLLKIITQKQPRLKLNHQKAGSPPLLLLPLLFPSHSAHPLTPWNTIDIHLPSFLLHFSSPILQTPDDDGERDQEIKSRNTFPIIPGGKYSHVSYVRVYANCRLRRIWFGENDPKLKAPWEFELYSI